MKGFFQQYSYSIVKMFVNQFVMSMFGFGLAMATIVLDNNILTLITSIFSVAFYLYLIYTMTWEIGAKDQISVEFGKKSYHPHTGLAMSLIANIPNILIALLYGIVYPFMERHEWAGNINAVLNVISAIMEGMYRGLLAVITLPNSDVAIMRYWWSYFLIILPALITSWIAYLAGYKNIRIVAPLFDKKTNQGKKK